MHAIFGINMLIWPACLSHVAPTIFGCTSFHSLLCIHSIFSKHIYKLMRIFTLLMYFFFLFWYQTTRLFHLIGIWREDKRKKQLERASLLHLFFQLRKLKPKLWLLSTLKSTCSNCNENDSQFSISVVGNRSFQMEWINNWTK